MRVRVCKMTKTVRSKRITGDQAARCELAMMGKVVKCSNSEVNTMTEYILRTLGYDETYKGEDFLKNRIQRYSEENEVKYITVNTIMQELLTIAYCIDTHIEGEPAPFEEDYGTPYKASFCYVFTMNADDCSEFGDCFFSKKEDGFYHRVS